MAEGIGLSKCSTCGQVHFPPRNLCPRCHSRDLGPHTADHGSVEEVTVIMGSAGVGIATIAVADCRVIARVHRSTRRGDVLRLLIDSSSEPGPGTTHVPHGADPSVRFR